MMRCLFLAMVLLTLLLAGCGGSGSALPTTTLQEAIAAGQADARFLRNGWEAATA